MTASDSLLQELFPEIPADQLRMIPFAAEKIQEWQASKVAASYQVSGPDDFCELCRVVLSQLGRGKTLEIDLRVSG